MNSNEKTKLKVNPSREMSPLKCLKIQKLQTAYAPKKSDNKNISCPLPRVQNNNFINKGFAVSGKSTHGKEEEEMSHLSVSFNASSAQKLSNPEDGKVKKIYLSETQSGMISGIPCAPPSTPTVGMKSFCKSSISKLMLCCLFCYSQHKLNFQAQWPEN